MLLLSVSAVHQPLLQDEIIADKPTNLLRQSKKILAYKKLKPRIAPNLLLPKLLRESEANFYSI